MSQIQAVHAPVHTAESVRTVIEEAILIADDFDRDSGIWAVVFGKACDLLGARASTFVQPQHVALDPRLLQGGRH